MTDQKERPYDEFHPADYKKKEGKFWMLPQGVATHAELSPGAKILYATLFSLAMKYGVAFTKKVTLKDYLGNPSERTLLRWQNELIKWGFLRVLQKGRGMANSYYFLRHPLLGNAEEGEFQEGARYLHRNRECGTQTVVTEKEARLIFKDEFSDWCNDGIAGKQVSFPKPSWQYNRSKYSHHRAEWEEKLRVELESMSESTKEQLASELVSEQNKGCELKSLHVANEEYPSKEMAVSDGCVEPLSDGEKMIMDLVAEKSRL